jgi:photosystem II stability/assembly factor-like uncharacterized protein
MRGPQDDEIERRMRRPPGGKALARLLQLLDSAGLTEAAERSVAAAVGYGQVGEERRAALATLRPRQRAADGAAAVPVPRGPSTEQVARASAEAAERLTAAAEPAAPAWRSLGPVTIPNGQTYGASRVNVSGRVAAIAVDPSDPAHVLVGAANGGIWESRDRGATWAPRTDDAATLTTGALAFDPAHPGTVLCGTGEGNWWSWLGVGVLRSTDGGTTWSTLCRDPFVGEAFFDLRFDPGSAGSVLAATTIGLFTSSDGGAHWTRRRGEVTWSLAVGGGELLAGCSDGVQRSADGGATWVAVSLPGQPDSFDRLAVAVAPSNPAVAYAWGAGPPYVGPDDDKVPTPYLWRRRPSGSWTKVTPPAGVATKQAWYDWFLAVAPDRDGQVYLGAIEAYRGDLSGSSWTWLCISNKGQTGDSIHPDQHAIAFEPGHPDTIYVGSDGGLFLSPDRGVTWRHRNNGLVISEFEYLAQNAASASWLLGGLQDNGTARWTGSPVWEQVADGDGGDCAVNRSNPATVWHTFFHMSPAISHARGDRDSWDDVLLPLPDGEDNQSPFYPPVEASLTSGNTFAIAGRALYVTRDDGAHWARLPFPGGDAGSALAIPNADSIWVGTESGRIFRTSWTGSSWRPLTAPGSPRPGEWVSDLLVDSSGLTLWATIRAVGGGRVFVSTNGGSTWTQRDAGLPPLPVNAIEVDPTDRNRLWVAADLGVYQTLDSGAQWAPYGTGLPNAYVGDVLLNPAGRLLRAGTRNRGVWEVAVDGAAAVATAPLHRYFNASIRDHFYTTNWAELGGGGHGWVYEGVQCHVYTAQRPGTVPLHRYWNPQVGDHFYTTDLGELGGAGHGWHYEGVQCHVAPHPGAGTTPLHRYWSSQAGDHFYTTNFGELGSGGHGYAYEGIQCYVRTSPTPAAEPVAEAPEAVPPTFTVTGPLAAGGPQGLVHWSGVLGGGVPPEPPAWAATPAPAGDAAEAAQPPASFRYAGPPPGATP